MNPMSLSAKTERVNSIVRRQEGRTEVRCPHCKRWSDLLDYRPLEVEEECVDDLHIILRCRRCRHGFAPRDLG